MSKKRSGFIINEKNVVAPKIKITRSASIKKNQFAFIEITIDSKIKFKCVSDCTYNNIIKKAKRKESNINIINIEIIKVWNNIEFKK